MSNSYIDLMYILDEVFSYLIFLKERKHSGIIFFYHACNTKFTNIVEDVSYIKNPFDRISKLYFSNDIVGCVVAFSNENILRFSCGINFPRFYKLLFTILWMFSN